jgi:hypothetical protein
VTGEHPLRKEKRFHRKVRSPSLQTPLSGAPGPPGKHKEATRKKGKRRSPTGMNEAQHEALAAAMMATMMCGDKARVEDYRQEAREIRGESSTRSSRGPGQGMPRTLTHTALETISTGGPSRRRSAGYSGSCWREGRRPPPSQLVNCQSS